MEENKVVEEAAPEEAEVAQEEAEVEEAEQAE